MEVKASLKYLRISPRKTRLVINLIKGLPAGEAEQQLIHLAKRSKEPVLKLLRSAIANAEHNFQLDKDNLYVKIARVDEGPTLKRWRPRARGVAAPINKRMSHLVIILDEITEKSKQKKVIKKITEKTIIKEGKEELADKKEAKTLKIKKPHFKKDKTRAGKKLSKGVVAQQKVFRRKSI